jgi:hypothetical protein
MADISSILSARPASALRGVGAETRAPTSAGFTLDGVLDRIDRVEEEKGELAGEFMRAFIEGQFRQRGVPIGLKSKGERELEKRQSALAATELQRMETENRVNDVVGWMMDNGKTKVNSFIKNSSDTRTFEELLGTRLDSSIMQRPLDLVAASEMLAEMSGVSAFRLQNSDLLKSKFTQPFAKQDAGQRDADKLAEQTSAQRDSAENVEFQQELQSGDSPVAQSLIQRLGAIGETIGQDIVPDGTGGGIPFVRFFGDDFDEAKGSAGVASAVLQHGEQFQALGPEVMIGMLMGPVGKRVGAVLKGGDVLQAADGRRILTIGDGDLSNDRQAVSNYIALIDQVSTVTNRSRTELLQLMGMPFDDFDEAELNQARLDLFGQNE